MDKKLINIVKGDINTAILNGSYNRNTAYQTNIEFNTPTKLILLDGVPYSNPSLTKVTWLELKDLRDNNRLIAGSLYRITDYQCTTTQENTQSAGHQFDIVLLALSANKLAEEGWAMMNESNIYDVTFADGVTKKCYIYEYVDEQDVINYNIVDVETKLGVTGVSVLELQVNEENKTASTEDWAFAELTEENLPYNYFQNSNLSAWKVWYCLDNDKSRFAWADDSVNEDSPAYITNKVNTILYRNSVKDTTVYAWTSEDNSRTLYTASETPNVGDNLLSALGEPSQKYGTVVSYTPAHEGTGLPNGRGVIYRLIDEWNNDCPYDFKNIQFKRWAITALTSGSDEMKAALIYDADENPVYFGVKAYDSPVISGATLDDDNYIFAYTFDGALKDAEGNITHYDVSAAPFVGPQEFIDYMIEQKMGEGIADVCYDNFIGNYGEMDIEGDNLAPGLTLPNNVFFNSSYCYFDEDEDYWSYAFANCYGNSLKSYCSNNTFGNNCARNTFGNSCQNNTFGNGCGNNTFGNMFQSNTFGNYCTDSTFGNSFFVNTFGNSFFANTFGNNCGGNTFGNNCYNNTFGNYCSTNTFGNYCTDSTFGNNCGGNTFGNNAEKCSVGDGVQNITVSKDFMRYVIIENGNQKITITSNKTTSSSAYLQNFLIALGVNNSNNTKTISHNSVGDAFRTVYQNENSTSVDV